jgi:hypothetical protein
VVKLHRLNNPLSSNDIIYHINPNSINEYLQIPLSHLYSRGYLSSSNQSSFDDTYCNINNSESFIPPDDECMNTNILNNPLSSYHIYKYSRYERDRFYSRIKRAIIKKQIFSIKKSRPREMFSSSIFNQTNFLINIPTKISSRQRFHSNSNDIYPLLFDSNFNTLVQLSTNDLLKDSFFDIRIFFHLIHSIASQEFQIYVHNYDNQHQLSYTSLSLINILRETISNYERKLKRNYFQSFHYDEQESTINHDQESFIPPLKIRRYDDSSYEIEKHSTSSSSSSSSSGMFSSHINNGQQRYEDRRRFETRPKKFPTRISDNQINSNFSLSNTPMGNFSDMDKKDIPDITVGSPLQNDLSIIDHQQAKEYVENRIIKIYSSLSFSGPVPPLTSFMIFMSI